MLGGAGILWYLVGSQNMWTGACLKVGLVMAALWLALPSISRHGHWGSASGGAIAGTLALALVLAGKKVDLRLILPMLFGVTLAILVLRPRSKFPPR